MKTGLTYKMNIHNNIFVRLNNLLFYLIIIFLPFTSVYIMPSIFREWSNNLAMPFFYMALFLFFLRFLYQKQIIIDEYIKKMIKDLFIYFSIYFIITIIMNWYLVTFVNIHIFPDNKIPIYSLKIFLPLIIFLIIIYTIINFNNINKLKKFIQLSLIIFFIMELYGYLQIYTLFIHHGFLYKFYLFVESFLDKGWGGKNVELFGHIPMSIILFRINLLTPEPSEAGHYILTYCYPFILATFVSNYSIFKKIIFIKIETLLFILSIPLIIFTFSTSAYVIFILLLVLTFILSLFNAKSKFRYKSKMIFFSLVLIFLLFLVFLNNINYIIPIFDKLSNTNNGSTHTRLYGIIGGVFLFLNYPFGVGFANLRYILHDYLPKPLNAEQLLEYTTGQAFQPKSLSIIYLDSFGLIGLVIAIYFFYKIYKNLKNIKNISKFSFYIFYSFIIFLISFLLESFNSSSFSILWMWVLIGFFVSSANKQIWYNDILFKRKKVTLENIN